MNSLASILVHMDSSAQAATRLRVARHLSEAHDAELTALYAVSSIANEYAFGIAGAIGSAASLIEIEDAKRRRTRESFNALTDGMARRPTWREVDAQPEDALARRARLTDLLVLGQPEPGARNPDGLSPSFVGSVVIDSGRAALIVPCGPAPTRPPGRIALIAWKNSRESARAISAALPLLQRCERVALATWPEGDTDGGEADAEAADAAHYLELHGVRCAVHRRPRSSVPIGDALLSYASDVSADLLVMGCFGHWRVRERVFGGVTNAILRSMTLPVLMAH